MESLVVKSTDTSEIEPLAVRLAELETYSQTQFKEVLEEVQALRDLKSRVDRSCELATNPHNRKTVILDYSANIRINYQ
jgi:flagellar motor switch protein FliG